MPMLKIDPNDPQAEQKELEFTVKCALAETPQNRLDRWLDWNLGMLRWMEQLHGRQKTPQIVKRT